MKLLTGWLLTLLLATTTVHAVELANIFTDHMVLQRGLPVPVWGTGRAGDTITVEFAGQKRTGRVDAAGRWQVTLKPLTASAKPRDLIVKSKTQNQPAIITDVLVGEVWLASGQSNMEWPLIGTANASNAIAHATDPQLRFFTVNHHISDTPLTTLAGNWTNCTPATVAGFSAVGYYFGRDLRHALAVPVGVIRSAWGGTPAQAWTSRAAMLANPHVRAIVEDYERAVREFDPVKAEEAYQAALLKHQAAVEQAAGESRPPPAAPVRAKAPVSNFLSPARIYNAKIAPLAPLAIRGVIWYQGENDSGQAGLYRHLFPTLIQDWRRAFGREFPFLFVQIAPHKYMVPAIRDAQLYTWRTVPRTAMVVITDHGDAEDIHPPRKEPVGARLALAARALAYGEQIEYSGPVFDKQKFDGARAILNFQHVGAGLVAEGGPLTGFEMAGADQKFFPATATITGKQIVVTSDKVPAPVAVRFGWATVPVVNLFNKQGLPASPFRTDNW